MVISKMVLPHAIIKKLINFARKAAENFKYHIWNRHILLVNILKKTGKSKDTFDRRPSVHPYTRTIKVFGRNF